MTLSLQYPLPGTHLPGSEMLTLTVTNGTSDSVTLTPGTGASVAGSNPYTVTIPSGSGALTVTVGGKPPITGYQAWYDASDANALRVDGSGHVVQWLDKSANYYDLVPNSGASANTSNARNINGLTACDLSLSASQALLSSCPADDITSTTFVVIRPDTFGVNRTMVGSSADGGNQFRFDTGGTLQSVKMNQALIFGSQVASAAANHIVAQRLDTLVVDHYLDGVHTTSAHAQTLTAGRTLAVGNNIVAGGEPFDGLIGEIIRYSTTLSDADVATTLAYLSAKWGI